MVMVWNEERIIINCKRALIPDHDEDVIPCVLFQVIIHHGILSDQRPIS